VAGEQAGRVAGRIGGRRDGRAHRSRGFHGGINRAVGAMVAEQRSNRGCQQGSRGSSQRRCRAQGGVGRFRGGLGR
jgi:hypothetical protein